MSTRARGLDAVRVIAMLAIVAGHLWTAHYWVRPVLFTWHVPIFFFLAGYLWNEKRGLVAEVRNRALTLLVPFVAWLVLLTVLLYRDHLDSTLHDLFWQAWYGEGYMRPFWAYWFAPALFFAAIAYRLVSRLGWIPRTVVVVALAVGTSELAGAGHLLRLNLSQGLVCLLWILAGHGLRALDRSADARWGRHHDLNAYRAALGVAMLVSAALWIAASSADLDVDLNKIDLGVPVQSVLLSVLICTGVVLVATTIGSYAVPEVTSDLARAALVVMLVHVALIEQAGGLSDAGPGRYVVVSAASWGLGLVLITLRRTSWLTGQRPRPGQQPEIPSRISERIAQPVPAHAE
ncbi:MAG: acyltransferase family protein [Marmoricola sp.]